MSGKGCECLRLDVALGIVLRPQRCAGHSVGGDEVCVNWHRIVLVRCWGCEAVKPAMARPLVLPGWRSQTRSRADHSKHQRPCASAKLGNHTGLLSTKNGQAQGTLTETSCFALISIPLACLACLALVSLCRHCCVALRLCRLCIFACSSLSLAKRL